MIQLQGKEKGMGVLLGILQILLMNITILSWNVRGLNDVDKQKMVTALIRSQRVDLICLQETKVQRMLEMLVRKLGAGRFLNWESVDLRGQSGGILVFQDNGVLELLEMEMGVHSLSCRFKNCDDNFIWLFFGV